MVVPITEIKTKMHYVKQDNDEKLMSQVKKGDLDALAPLFEKYHIKLYNFFLRLTGNKSNSQDLTQSVFRRILTYRKSYNENYKFRSWMYQIARNEHLSHYSQNRINISDYIDSEQLKYESQSALEEMESEYRKKILYEAISKLTAEQREIIELSRFQGLKYREIAEITGSSESAVKVRSHRALNKLKKLYFELA